MLAAGVEFIMMNGGNHLIDSISTYPKVGKQPIEGKHYPFKRRFKNCCALSCVLNDNQRIHRAHTVDS